MLDSLRRRLALSTTRGRITVIAAVAAIIALVSAGLAKVLMLIVNAIACVVFFVVILLATQGNWDRLRDWRSFTAPISRGMGTAIFVSAAVVLLSAPVLSNFTYGQVNVILAVAVDQIARGRQR